MRESGKGGQALTDGHHVRQFRDVEESGHCGGEEAGDESGVERRFEAFVDLKDRKCGELEDSLQSYRREEAEDNAVGGHGVENARQRKHGAQQRGGKSVERADGDDPFSPRPAHALPQREVCE